MPDPYTMIPGGPDGCEITLSGPPTLSLLRQCCEQAAERALLALDMPGHQFADQLALSGSHAVLTTLESVLRDLSALDSVAQRLAAAALTARVLRSVQVAEARLLRLASQREGN